MEAKFTKGEWNIIHTPEYHKPKCSTLEIHSNESCGWICKIQNNGIIEEDEALANAKLISAALDMLEENLKNLEFLRFIESKLKDFNMWSDKVQLLYERISNTENSIKKAIE